MLFFRSWIWLPTGWIWIPTTRFRRCRIRRLVFKNSIWCKDFDVNDFSYSAPAFGFGQPAFGGPAFGAGVQPGPGTQTSFTGSTQTLDNRFGEDEPNGGTVVTGGTQTITSQNGNFQVVSSVLKPNGQVVTTQQSGKFPSKKNWMHLWSSLHVLVLSFITIDVNFMFTSFLIIKNRHSLTFYNKNCHSFITFHLCTNICVVFGIFCKFVTIKI